MHLQVVLALALLDLQAAQHFQHAGFPQVAGYQDSAYFVVKQLFLDGEEGAGEVAVTDEDGHCVLVDEIGYILLEVELIGIEPFLVVVLFGVGESGDDIFHHFSRFVDSSDVGEDEVDVVGQDVPVLYPDQVSFVLFV